MENAIHIGLVTVSFVELDCGMPIEVKVLSKSTPTSTWYPVICDRSDILIFHSANRGELRISTTLGAPIIERSTNSGPLNYLLDEATMERKK